jgi:hypothetical protein
MSSPIEVRARSMPLLPFRRRKVVAAATAPGKLALGWTPGVPKHSASLIVLPDAPHKHLSRLRRTIALFGLPHASV